MTLFEMGKAVSLDTRLQEEFLNDDDFLRYYCKLDCFLKPELRKKALRLAKKLILKAASQLAGTGSKKGTLYQREGVYSDEIELDSTLEKFVNNPIEPIEENLVTLDRRIQEQAFVMMMDHSYSMRGTKMILAALTLATIACHFKKNYGVVAFNTSVSALKTLTDNVSHEELIERVFNLTIEGLTNISGALQTGLSWLEHVNKKWGLLLTDGSWTAGENPLTIASKFDRLNVLAFPPAHPDMIKKIAEAGHGNFQFVEDEKCLINAIIKVIQ